MNDVEDACSVTRYRKICVKSLFPFSNRAKKSPSKWARVAVSVTLREAKRVASYLARFNKSTGALTDCVDLLQEAVDELHGSLKVLRSLSVDNFDAQMGDLSTWLSATLTDQETCLDGFEEDTREKRVGLVRKRVVRVGYLTSNALAIVNKLASTGLDSHSHFQMSP